MTGFRARNVPVFFTGDGTMAPVLVTAFSGTAPGTTGNLLVTGADALMGLNAMALDDGSGGSFDTGTPPTVAAAGAAVQLASYGSGGSAAIGVRGQSVMFGFPFETLVDQPTRVEVMRRVLAFLSPNPFDGGIVMVDAGTVLDAGVPDSGVTVDAGMIAGDAGSPQEDAGVLRQPLLAFEGGGCSAAPLLVPLLALLMFRRRGRHCWR